VQPEETATFIFGFVVDLAVVLSALKETVWPDFVLNRTVVGFATTLTASNLTLFLAISRVYHSLPVVVTPRFTQRGERS
jgi:hypothetical protein